MKSAIFLISFICSSSFLLGQWDVYPQHVSFRTMNTGFDEWTHYTPFDISFWTNTNYNQGSSLTPTNFAIYNLATRVDLDIILEINVPFKKVKTEFSSKRDELT